MPDVKRLENSGKILQRHCPVCGHNQGEILYPFRFVIPIGSRLPEKYDLVSCDQCGFVFADTPAGQQTYDLYYTEQSKYEDMNVSSGGVSSSWDRERFHSVANHLATYIPKNSAILDVGCANGGLLLALREAGYKTIIGLDPSSRCVENVREIGIETFQGGIFSRNLPFSSLDRFDCILLSHVLEHIHDLKEALCWVSELLAPNGKVYVEVPDASRYADYYKVPFYYFDCEHINHYDPVSLENLWKSAGFITCDICQKDIRASAMDDYPVISAIFQRQNGRKSKHLPLTHQARNSIDAYLHISIKDEVYETINTLADKGEELIVWGAGQYALRLLSSTRLAECRIKAFIDKDRNKQGTILGKLSILPPEALYGHHGPVVICSALHSAEISAEIRHMGFNNQIVVLKGCT